MTNIGAASHEVMIIFSGKAQTWRRIDIHLLPVIMLRVSLPKIPIFFLARKELTSDIVMTLPRRLLTLAGSKSGKVSLV